MASKSKSALMAKLGTKCISLLRYSALLSVFCMAALSLVVFWVCCLPSARFMSAFKGPFSPSLRTVEQVCSSMCLKGTRAHIYLKNRMCLACIIGPVQSHRLKYAVVLLMSVTTRESRCEVQQKASSSLFTYLCISMIFVLDKVSAVFFLVPWRNHNKKLC